MIKIADALTDILFFEEGITDTARAVHDAMEEDLDYKNALYLIYRVQEEQCTKIRKIIEEIGRTSNPSQEECVQ